MSRARASTTSRRCCASRRRISISSLPPREMSAIKAVGNPAPVAARSEYRSKVKNHSAQVDGLPLGTRDGLIVEHYFPADGEYVFNMHGLVGARRGATRLSARLVGVRAHGDPHDRRRQGVRGQLGRRGGPARGRSLPNRRGQRDQRPVPRDPPAGPSRVPEGGRDVHRAQFCRVRSPPADLHSRRGDSGRAPDARLGGRRTVRADRHQREHPDARACIHLLPRDRSG